MMVALPRCQQKVGQTLRYGLPTAISKQSRTLDTKNIHPAKNGIEIPRSLEYITDLQSSNKTEYERPTGSCPWFSNGRAVK